MTDANKTSRRQGTVFLTHKSWWR